MQQDQKPCPQCGSPYCGPVACRFTGIQHQDVVPLPGAPFYGPDLYTDPDDLPGAEEVFEPRDSEDEDHRLDDPRHGQAAWLNRYRGRE